MTRREHIEQLAADMGVDLEYGAPRYMMAANVLLRFVRIHDWDGDVPPEETYWVALHELGHIATTPVYDRTESTLEYEARAWAWALEHAIFPLDTAGQSAIAWGITDYGYHRGLDPEASEAMRKIVAALGPEPDWHMNVTTDAHREKLEGWAKPTWAQLVALVAA